MRERNSALRALQVVSILGIASFWLQAAWDLTHPPAYHGPHGVVSP